MIIRDKDNFLPLIAKMLTALNYDKVEMHTGKPYDITAVKDDKKYCSSSCHIHTAFRNTSYTVLPTIP